MSYYNMSNKKELNKLIETELKRIRNIKGITSGKIDKLKLEHYSILTEFKKPIGHLNKTVIDKQIKEKNKEKTIEKEKEKEYSIQTTALNANFYLFNLPADYKKCMEMIAMEPMLQSTLKKTKIKTFYFYDSNSLSKIHSTVLSVFNQQTKIFKMSLSFGFIYQVKQNIEGKTNYIYRSHRPSNSIFYKNISSHLIKDKNAINKVISEITADELKT